MGIASFQKKDDGPYPKAWEGAKKIPPSEKIFSILAAPIGNEKPRAEVLPNL